MTKSEQFLCLQIGGENFSCSIDHQHGVGSRFEHGLAVGVSPLGHLTSMSGNGTHIATCALILTHYNHKTDRSSVAMLDGPAFKMATRCSPTGNRPVYYAMPVATSPGERGNWTCRS